MTDAGPFIPYGLFILITDIDDHFDMAQVTRKWLAFGFLLGLLDARE
jgi:hypothetical protein